jgi:PKHD-type hydroxylase
MLRSIPGVLTAEHVTPVTRSTRCAAFFWIQSMIRDDSQRSPLLHLDLAIHRSGRDQPGNPVARRSALHLAGVNHSRLRQWAEL